MAKTKMYAILIRKGVIIKREFIGCVILDENRCSARRYSELCREAKKAFPRIGKNEYVTVITERGDECRNTPVVVFATFDRTLILK